MKLKHTILDAVCASLLIAVSSTAQAVAVSGQGTWETTLQGRDLDGDLSTFEAYYDATLDITWLADANYAFTSGYATVELGQMKWGAANIWAASLDPYGSGITGWRLPTTTDTGIPGCNYAYSGTDCGFNVDTATSELSYMFFVTLGNLGYFSTSGEVQPGGSLTNTGPFANVYTNDYWSATKYATSSGNAWYFTFYYGGQSYSYKGSRFYAWAVHTGDVGASVVPVPAAAWLFGSGLLGLVGVSRTRRAEPAGHSRLENPSQPCMRRTHTNVKHILLASLRRSPKPAQRLLTCLSAVAR